MILMKICYVIYYMCHVLKTVEHNTNYPSRIKNPFLIVFIQIMEYKVYIIKKKKKSKDDTYYDILYFERISFHLKI